MSKMQYKILICCAIICGILVGCNTRTKDNRTVEDNFNHSKRCFSENMGIEYQLNEDGTYTCEGNVYLYKLSLEGKDNNSEKTAKFIVLTNNSCLTFDEVFDTLISSNLKVGKPDFVILGLE